MQETTCNAGSVGSIPGFGRSLEKEMATYSSQYSCLGNPMDRGAWWPTVQLVAIVRYSFSNKTTTTKHFMLFEPRLIKLLKPISFKKKFTKYDELI